MKRKTSIMLTLLSVIIMTSFVLVGCGSNESQTNEKKQDEEVEDVNDSKDNNESYTKEDNPLVTIEMKDGKKIDIELYPEVAPNTVNNFISLIDKGYYDGLIFHRVIPGFMVQGGDSKGDGSGGPGYGIKGEFEANDIENDIVHSRGILSMARTEDPDSAGSQFFIMTKDSSHLDGEYAGFGKVIDGMDVVDEIVESEADQNDKPLMPQTMKKVTVDLKGEAYDEPEIIE